jgi:hypothetical protein
MTPERSRQLGQALMAISIVQLLVFVLAAMRKSYAALAVPVFFGLTLISGLAFWVGWTMAAAQWEEEEAELEAAS